MPAKSGEVAPPSGRGWDPALQPGGLPTCHKPSLRAARRAAGRDCGQLAPREVAEAPAGDTESLLYLVRPREYSQPLAANTSPSFSVSVHCAQSVLRSPRPSLLGRHSQPSLEVLVPAPRRLAASRPLSLETQNLPGTAEGERVSCRSPGPRLLLTSLALGCAGAGAGAQAPGLGRRAAPTWLWLKLLGIIHCWFMRRCRRPDGKMPFPRHSLQRILRVDKNVLCTSAGLRLALAVRSAAPGSPRAPRPRAHAPRLPPVAGCTYPWMVACSSYSSERKFSVGLFFQFCST